MSRSWHGLPVFQWTIYGVLWHVVHLAASMAAKAFVPLWQVPQFWPGARLAMLNFAVPFGIEKVFGRQSAQFRLRPAWLA